MEVYGSCFDHLRHEGVFEHYHLKDDPEVLNDFSSIDTTTFNVLKKELLDNLAIANCAYEED